MNYKIIRLDGREDKLTIIVYRSYDEAYEVLENTIGDICCSDADYDLLPSYDIMEI
tara:strand:+ start:355 stop:522 length:168 start_codon:yes stop_codon:yes gene_type:complete